MHQRIAFEGGAAPTGHTYMSAENSARAWAVHNGSDETPTTIARDRMWWQTHRG
tara:strand:- start:449 stop:610 length:162 start_codon:yes stop_codon:yes gene_type:complete